MSREASIGLAVHMGGKVRSDCVAALLPDVLRSVLGVQTRNFPSKHFYLIPRKQAGKEQITLSIELLQLCGRKPHRRLLENVLDTSYLRSERFILNWWVVARQRGSGVEICACTHAATGYVQQARTHSGPDQHVSCGV
jgi:hypothetical protein